MGAYVEAALEKEHAGKVGSGGIGRGRIGEGTRRGDLWLGH